MRLWHGRSGGYQFVGRTLQMWNRYRQTREFQQPWLLRFFDQIRFYEVSNEELQRIRRDFPQGRYPLKIEQSTFNLLDYQEFVGDNQAQIDAFVRRRNDAFDAELERWHADGQFNFKSDVAETAPEAGSWPEHHTAVGSPVSGSVWQALVTVGDSVKTGEVLMILESMKMEIPIPAPCGGEVMQLLVNEGGRVNAGQALLVIEE